MKKLFIFIISFILLIFLFLNFVPLSKKIVFIRKEISQLLFPDSSDAILFLGKMGQGYYGGENTDSIFIFYLKNKNAYVIYIPRDLIVKINNDLYKINSLYGSQKINELLFEVSNLTGIRTRKYIVIDSYILRKIVDMLGGVNVELKEFVVDPVSGYTLKPGKHNLSGELLEFVVRSRFYPYGDFQRMKNQFIIIKSIKEKLENTTPETLFKILNFLISDKRYIHTNLKYKEFVDLAKKTEVIRNENIYEIIFDLKSGLWSDGYFEIKLNSSYSYSYGLIPKDGIGRYKTIRKRIQEKIRY